MRRPLVMAGLSVAALVSVAAAGRQIEARAGFANPKAITVVADAARLAQAVTPGQLADLVLDRLHNFQRNPVWGHRDHNGKDRLKAWVWTYLARAAVVLYQQTHDRRLIEAVLTRTADYAAAARPQNVQSAYGWYTDDAQTGTSYREVPVAGLIMAPVVDLLLAAQQDADLELLVGPQRGALMRMLEDAAAGVKDRYLEDHGHGYYLLPSGEDVVPLNLSSIYAEPLLGLWQLTHKPEYLRQVTGIARTWKTLLQQQPGKGVTWPYWPKPAPADLRKGPRERLVKAAAGIMFPKAAYQAGIVLDRHDISAIAGVPFSTLMVQLDAGHVLIRKHVDPGSDSYLTANRADGDSPLALGAWYVYRCFDMRLAADLDRVMFGIDATFYQHNMLALLGLAKRMAAEREPGGCADQDSAAAAQPMTKATLPRT